MNGAMPFGSAERVERNLPHIKDCGWCLQRAAMTNPAFLPTSLRKKIGGQSATTNRKVQDTMNTRKELKKTVKVLKTIGTGVNLSGAGSTAAGRQSNADLSSLLRSATEQTRQVEGRALSAFEDRVRAAKSALSKASDEYEASRAKAALADALKARCGAELVAQANAQASRRVAPGRFGPNSTDLFGGTSLTLGEDRAVKGL